MESTESVRVLEQRAGSMKQAPGKERWLPPWLFKHHDLTHALGDAKKVSQQSITNILNHIHFVNGHVMVLLKPPRFEEVVLLRAHPEPCLGTVLQCSWEGGVRKERTKERQFNESREPGPRR